MTYNLYIYIIHSELLAQTVEWCRYFLHFLIIVLVVDVVVASSSSSISKDLCDM